MSQPIVDQLSNSRPFMDAIKRLGFVTVVRGIVGAALKGLEEAVVVSTKAAVTDATGSLTDGAELRRSVEASIKGFSSRAYRSPLSAWCAAGGQR